MAEKTPVKIFIASSAELKDEREKCVLLINQLNESHKHLQLKPVEWEYSMVHANYPSHKNIQGAITPLLLESDLIIFIFYSKIGPYTRQEFEEITKIGKRLFAFFKTGFSPDKNALPAYSELLDFKDSLNDTVLYKEYTDLTDFEKQLFSNLNLYLSENYSQEVGRIETTAILSQSNLTLIRMLEEKEKQIKELNEKLLQKPSSEPQVELQQLIQDKEAIQKELLQSEEIRQQQAKEKEALEQRLALQTENDNLKAKALEEVEKGNYADAEAYLKESAKEKISDVASTFFELAKIKELQLQYAEAYHYYELAVKINPINSEYLNETGSISYTLGYYNKAIDYYERSLHIEIKENGEEHPNIARDFNNLGSAYDSKGEYDKAISYFEKALALDKKFYAEEHPDMASSYNNLGLAYKSKGEYDKAISYYNLSLQIFSKFISPEHPTFQIVQQNLAYAIADLEKQKPT